MGCPARSGPGVRRAPVGGDSTRQQGRRRSCLRLGPGNRKREANEDGGVTSTLKKRLPDFCFYVARLIHISTGVFWFEKAPKA